MCHRMNGFFKKILLTLMSVLLLHTAHAQAGHSPLDEVLNSIKGNRIHDMARYLDNFVPISINNNQSNYSNNQAELVLRDFFDKNVVKEFKVMESGSPAVNSRFAISSFVTNNNARYTIYIMMRQKENTYVVKEIRISKE